jgi:hypothetical protein
VNQPGVEGKLRTCTQRVTDVVFRWTPVTRRISSAQTQTSSVDKELICVHKPDPSSSPLAYSGPLLGRFRGLGLDRVDPRMPWLEGHVHIPILVVNQVRLHEN